MAAAFTRRRHGGAAAASPGEWAAVSVAGAWRVEEVGKHQLMRRTGLPARDLRALDPALSYPCSIMGRDRAVVVNLERARAVITATEVLVPAPQDPAVAPLVRNLRARLVASASPTPPRASEEDEAAQGGGALPPSPAAGGRDDGQGSSARRDKVLPFEFRALEVCLEFSCKSLDHETCTLEKEAYPALDELSSNVSTLNLERVRQIKSRLLAISGRVQKLREYVDDTEDFINIMLDDKQNQLLQMGILLSTATLVMSGAIAVTGVFGMNITIPLYTDATEGVFWNVTGGIVGATVAIYLIALIFYKRGGILQ